jgi:hypothetical protein
MSIKFDMHGVFKLRPQLLLKVILKHPIDENMNMYMDV